MGENNDQPADWFDTIINIIGIFLASPTYSLSSLSLESFVVYLVLLLQEKEAVTSICREENEPACLPAGRQIDR
jgi:hypothetical protein